MNYFLRDPPEEEKEKAEKCLGLVKFGMANTLVTFEDQYYIYGGDLPVENKGLTIGGFESALFADLVAAYLLENVTQLSRYSCYNSIYCDDGINIINGKRSTEQMVDWLNKFQARMNKLNGSEYLKFTLDIWDPDSPEEGNQAT